MPGWVPIAADAAVGVALTGAGIVVLRHRRERRIALLLLLAAVTWFAGNLLASLTFVHRGPMAHLHLSYPTGRLHRWPAVIAVAAAYLWALAEGWFHAPALTAVLAALVAAAAADSFLRTRGPARKAALPAFVAALLFASILGLSAANQILRLDADLAVALTYDAVMIVVTVWLTADLLRGRWTEATVADLVAQLGRRPQAVGLTAELRRAVGDPKLALGYWDDAAQRYVDDAGAPVEAAGPGVTRVDDDGRPVAVLVHDPALGADSALLDGAVAAVRLTVGSDRMRNEIRARADALAAARRRIIEAGDDQRRALQVELADGPGAHLHRARASIADLATRRPDDGELAQVLAGIDAATEELGRFAQGLRPTVLEAEGLRVAISLLAERAGPQVTASVSVERLPPAVEAAIWFVCSEALTNVAKHARASSAHVEVTAQDGAVVASVTDNGAGGADPDGTGLRGLADRVAALGGTLTVTEGSSGGTLVSARIPVADEPARGGS